MENFKMPIRQVKKTYKRSEIAMIAWRSRETAWQMHVRMKTPTTHYQQNSNPTSDSPQTVHGQVRDTGTAWVLPEGVNNGVPIPKHFFNADGYLDLSQVKGTEAAGYLHNLGINIPNLAFLADRL